MTMHEIKVSVTHPSAIVPKRQSDGAAGYDIHAVEQGILLPNETRSVRTGLVWHLPQSIVGLIFGRSGLALNNWIDVHNTSIHSRCISELSITMTNNGKEPFEYKESSRIAQVVFVPTVETVVDVMDSLYTTERGCLGFGSTGMK
ncbi:dUTPase [Ordospora colligata]|uniref:Deoxyuridine 5'-triphosphate nucleotidohydrolase n=1 Tax=Ordospora colligata OC4 TaxID=1354746 RepID=A0A0B2UKH6_9MICR|nr:dUTPase [Ordospora colligata OC4]KHN69547.1 dUTPase [Ordospora colligata OC4]TBU15367.1 dUTPase [Ordospora colligata]TBU15467.1 dUTPase [Ordospora colligata]TBU18563.1 dUTPase [Ordospora colligata]